MSSTMIDHFISLAHFIKIILLLERNKNCHINFITFIHLIKQKRYLYVHCIDTGWKWK